MKRAALGRGTVVPGIGGTLQNGEDLAYDRRRHVYRRSSTSLAHIAAFLLGSNTMSFRSRSEARSIRFWPGGPTEISISQS
jgi:hypothetical protein